MITIILEAKDIPEGFKVRKPTGSKLYSLKKSLKLYGHGASIVQSDPSVMFLIDDEGNINIISEGLKLAMDFGNRMNAIEFLNMV